MPPESSNTLATESFPPGVCPACGYLLTGLPPIGVCPECGIAYDDSQLILHGWACGQHATPSNSRGRRFLFALVPFFFLWPVFQPMKPNPWRLGFLAIWLGSVVPSLFRRKTTDHPGGIQLRMNHRGILQIDDLRALQNRPMIDPTNFVPWKKLEMSICKSPSKDRLRLRLKTHAPWYKPVSTAYPVDADLQCTPDDAENLRKQIIRWGVH